MNYPDLGAMWRAGYDMTPEQFSAELERLWQQVKPLYVSLQAYVRTKLVEKYGPTAVDRRRTHSRRPAGQSLGAGVGQHLPAGRAAATEAGVRHYRPARREEG